jgi:hypothetical protein
LVVGFVTKYAGGVVKGFALIAGTVRTEKCSARIIAAAVAGLSEPSVFELSCVADFSFFFMFRYCYNWHSAVFAGWKAARSERHVRIYVYVCICILYACLFIALKFIYRFLVPLRLCVWVTLHHLPICIRAGVVLVSAAIYLHSKFPYKEAKLKNDDDARRDDDRSSTGSSSINKHNSNHSSSSGGGSTRAPAVSAAPPASSASGLAKKNE